MHIAQGRRLSAFQIRPRLAVLVACLLMLFLMRFLAVGWQRMLLNADSVNGDQGAYLQMGLDLREKGALSDGTRNPLYPALLATFADREWRYFTYAKFLSLAFGLLSILAVYGVGRRLFGLPTALVAALLLSINMEFILHSTFALAESLLVLCTLCAWFLMVRALQDRNSVWLWGAAGGLSGLAYLAKGTGQLAAACFVLAVLVLYGPRKMPWRALGVFALVYSLLALPLWIYNWSVFGSPTFNMAITHQMWMDKWEQNFVSDASQLPTIWTYWQTHTLSEAGMRAWNGLTAMRFFLVKMLWPTRSVTLDRFLLSAWSGAVLVIMVGGLLLARQRVWAFVCRHREAVVLTAMMGATFYVLFAWYIAIVPLPIRFTLPLLPLLLLFIAAGLAGIGQWALTPRSMPLWSKLILGFVGLLLGLYVGQWFVVSGLANGRALGQSPFDADSAFNSDSEQPLLWVSSGHSSQPVGVLVGAGSSLPGWRHSDRLRFVRLPTDIGNSAELDVFLDAKNIEYVVVDAAMAERSREEVRRRLGVEEITGDRITLGAWPSNWALGFVYPDGPCKWCVFRRAISGSPAYPVDFVLGGAIRLAGYDIATHDFRRGAQLTLTLYWESLKPVDTDYTVFTQLLGPDSQLHGQVDRQPVDGRWPTSRWLPGQRFTDKFTIPVDEGAPPGQYGMLVGLYDLTTGQRMAVTLDGQPVPDNAIALHRLTLVEGKKE